MSVNAVKVGNRVQIKDKDCQGTVAFTGYPSFASGKWIGVILDEAKGKNNGTVKGQSYFKVRFILQLYFYLCIQDIGLSILFLLV